MKHYSELYSVERYLDDTFRLPSLPEMTELDIEPSIAELSQASDDVSSGKVPGNDAIPAELLKLNKDAILLLIYCRREGVVQHDMRGASKITLYKNKGDKGDCNN